TMLNGPEIPTLSIGTVAVLALFTVTDAGADDVPVNTLPKSTVAGLAVTTPAAVPVPDRSTVTWPPFTLAAIVICPEAGPTASGLKITWISQLPPAETVAPWQLSVSLNPAPIWITVGFIAVVPVFESVTVWAALLVPTDWSGNVSDDGFTVAVVKLPLELCNGIIHRPRPYVAATSACGDAEG